MAWRDRLREASFRGVAFKVQSHSAGGGGRRSVQHEYPGRDEPFAEDLGRQARSYSMEAYVIGADYDIARNELIKACDAEGAATLSHPYLGELNVLCTGCVPREVDREGGIARFQLTFIEAGKNSFPTITADTRQQTVITAEAAQQTFSSDFADSFQTEDLPAFVAQDGVELAEAGGEHVQAVAPSLGDQALSVLAAGKELAGQTQATIRDTVGLATQARGAVNSVVGEVVSVAGVGFGLVNSVTGIVGTVTGALNPAGILSALRRLGNFNPSLPSIPSTTATRQIQGRNRTAFTSLIQRLSISTEAVALSSFEFSDREAAIVARDSFAERIDALTELASFASEPDSVCALRLLRTAVMLDLTARAPRLPKVVTQTLPATAPALVIAHRLHGSAERAPEIATRNAVRNPLFVPGGTPIEVLADG